MNDSDDISASIELAIVNVFTQLIFAVEQEWSEQELSIIQALRTTDHNIYMDSNREMGIYLRALGVQEMIGLVSEVKSQLQQGAHYTLEVAAPKRSASPIH